MSWYSDVTGFIEMALHGAGGRQKGPGAMPGALL